MKRASLMLATAFLVFAPSPALAGCPDEFEALDTDSSGDLTRSEYYAVPLGPPFERYDANGDGVITLVEFLIDCA